MNSTKHVKRADLPSAKVAANEEFSDRSVASRRNIADGRGWSAYEVWYTRVRRVERQSAALSSKSAAKSR
jgi:hypothetical protein